jgi:hypothetical protein
LFYVACALEHIAQTNAIEQFLSLFFDGNSIKGLEKIKTELIYDPAIPLQDIYPKEMKSVCLRDNYSHV